jgi:hypothetical protein
MSSTYADRGYPEKFQRVRFYDDETNANLVFLTNNFKDIALPILSVWIWILFAIVMTCRTGYAFQDSADRQTPTLKALRVEAIDLDGRLTEEVWQRADVATGFTQREPTNGNPATERTEVRVLYTFSAIYVGVRAFDSQPDNIRTGLARRDQQSQADEIAIFFDSYHDRRTAFEFAVNPHGSIRDVYRFDDSPTQLDDSWDPIWQVKTSIDDSGWVAEFFIPLAQLRFNREKTNWGFQVYRRIHRKVEEVYWAPFSKEASGFVSHFGTLEGLENLSQPIRLEIRPYSVFGNRFRPKNSGTLYSPERQSTFNNGLDLKYGISSDFTLDLSINPDFGQVEADPAVVNLTAFESSLPEKRPFFVEGSGLFAVSPFVAQLLYSRRIGHRPQGIAVAPTGGTVEIPESTTILSAAKVTGKNAGGLGLGIMSVVTAEEKATIRNSMGIKSDGDVVEPLTHYFAGRIEQDFREGSHTIGSMVTAVNRRITDKTNFLRSSAYMLEVDGVHRWQKNTYGIRWNLAGSTLHGSRTAITAAQLSSLHYFQRPDVSHVELDTSRTGLAGYALRLEAGKNAGIWQYSVAAERISPGFDVSDLGFQGISAGAQNIYLLGQYLHTQAQSIFRDYRFNLSFTRTATTTGDVTWNYFSPASFAGRLHNNWLLTASPISFASWSSNSVSALRGGPALKMIPAWSSSLGIGMDPVMQATKLSRKFSFGLGTRMGGYFRSERDWDWMTINPALLIRPNDALNTILSLYYMSSRNPTQWVGQRTALDSTRYILADIDRKTLWVTARFNWIITPKLSIEFYGQPFVLSGAYSEFKEVIEPRAQKFEDRFHIYEDELEYGEDGQYAVDLDSDGSFDLNFNNPDFSFRQLRSTLLIRWEYRPGSVLFFAWQHGRQKILPNGSFNGFKHMADLFSEESDNIFLVKMNYWFSI